MLDVPGRLPSAGQASGASASTLPYLRSILGPPQHSTAHAEPICMRSAHPTVGCAALMGSSSLSAFTRPALAPWLISGSKRMDPLAPPVPAAASKVPESCHARRIYLDITVAVNEDPKKSHIKPTRIGPQFSVLIRFITAALQATSSSTVGVDMLKRRGR